MVMVIRRTCLIEKMALRSWNRRAKTEQETEVKHEKAKLIKWGGTILDEVHRV